MTKLPVEIGTSQPLTDVGMLHETGVSVDILTNALNSWGLPCLFFPTAEESQESSMTDADDTQLHTAESDEVL